MLLEFRGFSQRALVLRQFPTRRYAHRSSFSFFVSVLCTTTTSYAITGILSVCFTLPLYFSSTRHGYIEPKTVAATFCGFESSDSPTPIPALRPPNEWAKMAHYCSTITSSYLCGTVRTYHARLVHYSHSARYAPNTDTPPIASPQRVAVP